MKIRLGFVSNSSSSSFCIYGADFEPGTVRVMLQKKCKKDPKFMEDFRSAAKYCNSNTALNNEDGLMDWIEDADSFDLSQALENMESSLEATDGPSEGNCLYIGRSWASIGDNETGAQFKRSVEKIIKEIFGEDTVCSTYQEGWYNG